MKAKSLLDGLHGHLRDIDRHAKEAFNVDYDIPISSRWQELRSKFKSVEETHGVSTGASSRDRDPFRQSNIEFNADKRQLTAQKPTSSRQLASSSPLTQRTTSLNEEANRLLER